MTNPLLFRSVHWRSRLKDTNGHLILRGVVSILLSFSLQCQRCASSPNFQMTRIYLLNNFLAYSLPYIINLFQAMGERFHRPCCVAMIKPKADFSPKFDIKRGTKPYHGLHGKNQRSFKINLKWFRINDLLDKL